MCVCVWVCNLCVSISVATHMYVGCVDVYVLIIAGGGCKMSSHLSHVLRNFLIINNNLVFWEQAS